MKIASIKTFVVEIPFHDGGNPKTITPMTWHTLENVLVRVEDEHGNVGWGEAFGYFVADSVRAMIDRLIAPLAVGQTITNIAAWNLDTQLRLHIFGRYGVTMFGLSGVDMALWDLQAKREGLPLHHLLGGGTRSSIPAYASLVRYGEGSIAPKVCERALREGFKHIKLHENVVGEVAECVVPSAATFLWLPTSTVHGPSTPLANGCQSWPKSTWHGWRSRSSPQKTSRRWPAYADTACRYPPVRTGVPLCNSKKPFDKVQWTLFSHL